MLFWKVDNLAPANYLFISALMRLYKPIKKLNLSLWLKAKYKLYPITAPKNNIKNNKNSKGFDTSITITITCMDRTKGKNIEMNNQMGYKEIEKQRLIYLRRRALEETKWADLPNGGKLSIWFYSFAPSGSSLNWLWTCMSLTTWVNLHVQ